MKVYVDQSLVQKEFVSFLSPLLGLPQVAIWGEDKKQIEERHEVGKQLLSLVSQELCDYFVYPTYFRLDHIDEVRSYANDAASYGKKALVFSYGEIDDYIDISTNILRYKRSTKRYNPQNEFCLPPFPEDLLIYSNNSINFMDEGQHHPYTIGYTGYADYTDIGSLLYYIGVRIIGTVCRTKPLKRLLVRFKNERLYGRLINAGIGNYCRGKTIRQLKKLKKYNFHFTQRKHALTTYAPEDLREPYIKNLIHADFVLLVRGFGNYSIRQYEALSLGKIPLYIDTGAKLPFDDEIAYDDLFIRVPFEKVEHIGEYIDRYLQKNRGNLQDIQKQIRTLYEQYFVMKHYYTKIIDRLYQLENGEEVFQTNKIPTSSSESRKLSGLYENRSVLAHD